MGADYNFSCDNCSLSAEVSGGPDSGMYAEWTTIWCPDCKNLSDATTASEDEEAVAKYHRRTVAIPDNLRCPKCWSKGLRTFDQMVCPKCGTDKVFKSDSGGDWSEDLFVCETCKTRVKRTDCQPRLEVNPKDVVHVRLYCGSCDSYPLKRKRLRGAYVPPPKWKKHELKCRKCDSTNVQIWLEGQPCPSCGGRISRSVEVTAFTD